MLNRANKLDPIGPRALGFHRVARRPYHCFQQDSMIHPYQTRLVLSILESRGF